MAESKLNAIQRGFIAIHRRPGRGWTVKATRTYFGKVSIWLCARDHLKLSRPPIKDAGVVSVKNVKDFNFEYGEGSEKTSSIEAKITGKKNEAYVRPS